MPIRCRLLTAYEDALGASELVLDVEDGITADQLIARALSAHAELALTPGHPMVLLNGSEARPGARVTAGDEVALLPVMLGG